MNYQKIYDQIITSAIKESRHKGKDVYFENHHINPKCMGGDNNKNNRTLLNAREHFICHKLLTKIYPNNKKIFYAYFMISTAGNKKQNRYLATSREYARLKKIRSDMTKGHKVSKETIPDEYNL